MSSGLGVSQTTWLASGRAVDLALLLVAFEALALLALARAGRSRLRPLDVFGQLAAGAALLGALRCALGGADPRWTTLFLAAALPAHVYDLVRRVRRTSHQ